MTCIIASLTCVVLIYACALQSTATSASPDAKAPKAHCQKIPERPFFFFFMQTSVDFLFVALES